MLATQYILNTSLVTLLLHQLGNLRTITRIHREATNIQLWNVRTHNAFARVTVLAAIAITVLYVTATTFSALFSGNAMIALTIIIIALAVATLLFVGPLVGMRRRLVREKERQLSETDRVFEDVATSLRAGAGRGRPCKRRNLRDRDVSARRRAGAAGRCRPGRERLRAFLG